MANSQHKEGGAVRLMPAEFTAVADAGHAADVLEDVLLPRRVMVADALREAHVTTAADGFSLRISKNIPFEKFVEIIQPPPPLLLSLYAPFAGWKSLRFEIIGDDLARS